MPASCFNALAGDEEDGDLTDRTDLAKNGGEC
jgi:hypothetical protein